MKIGAKSIWIAGILAAVAAAWAVRDYHKWLSLGSGGLPSDPGGWLRMTHFRWMAKDGLDVTQLVKGVATENDLRAWHDLRLNAARVAEIPRGESGQEPRRAGEHGDEAQPQPEDRRKPADQLQTGGRDDPHHRRMVERSPNPGGGRRGSNKPRW